MERGGGSNGNTRFFSKNKKNNVYPVNTQFCYIKVGLRRGPFTWDNMVFNNACLVCSRWHYRRLKSLKHIEQQKCSLIAYQLYHSKSYEN